MDEHLLRFRKDKTLVFFDAETLNLCLNFQHNLPWQIAMLKVVGDRKIDEKDFLIKWDTTLQISEGAARITKYDPKKVERLGLAPEEVFPTVKDWLDNCDYILGHNTLGFDIYLIKEFYKMMGARCDHLYPKFIDTNCLARGMKMGLPLKKDDDLLEYQYRAYNKKAKGVKTNMTALGKEFDIQHDYDNLHDAIVDLELNLKIWNKLKYMIEV